MRGDISRKRDALRIISKMMIKGQLERQDGYELGGWGRIER